MHYSVEITTEQRREGGKTKQHQGNWFQLGQMWISHLVGSPIKREKHSFICVCSCLKHSVITIRHNLIFKTYEDKTTAMASLRTLSPNSNAYKSTSTCSSWKIARTVTVRPTETHKNWHILKRHLSNFLRKMLPSKRVQKRKSQKWLLLPFNTFRNLTQLLSLMFASWGISWKLLQKWLIDLCLCLHFIKVNVFQLKLSANLSIFTELRQSQK